MNNYLFRVIAIALMMLGVGSVQADTDEQLSSWQFIGQAPLPDDVKADPNLTVRFVGGFLLVGSPGLEAGRCGRLIIFKQNENGRLGRVQNLSAEDFNQTCDDEDGFGFSFALGHRTLFVGAPGQIMESERMLPAGAVFAYSVRNTRFIPRQMIAGSNEAGNRALGTLIETDGRRVLVQGNELGGQRTSHGVANPRSVNLLQRDNNGVWQTTRVFTDEESTVYGQDFNLNESSVFIARHTFIDFIDFAHYENLARFNSALDIYDINGTGEGGISSEVSQLIADDLVIFDNLETLPDFNYLIQRRGRFVLYFSEICACGSLGLNARRSGYSSYELEDGQWVIAPTVMTSSTADIGREDFGDPNTNFRFKYGPDRVYSLRLGSDRLTLDIIGDRLHDTIRTEQLFTTNSISPGFRKKILLNGNQLFVLDSEDELVEINAFSAVPALDPAITQAWWFGPEYNGQGVTMEVLPNNRLLMYWFTYDLSGRQMWVRGIGQLSDGAINMQLVRARGPRFPFGEFNPDDRVMEPWGQATIRFDDCTSGTLSYQSPEFGSGELPLTPVVDNQLTCGKGFIRVIENSFFRPVIAGSFFDAERIGEGIIFMPIPGVKREHFSISRAIGFWLTYTPTGEQAWHYLGVFEDCPRGTMPDPLRCELVATGEPRSTMGPVFGPAYDPNERVSMPWGTADTLKSDRVPFQNDLSDLTWFLDVENPHGSGQLKLKRATQPVEYSIAF